MEAKKRECGELRFEHGVAPAAVGRRESVVHDFEVAVCTGYASLIRTQAAIYPDLLNAVLAYA